VLGPENASEFGQGAGRVVSDPDITDAPLILHAAQRRQMGAPIHEIVDLNQVKDFGLQQLRGAAHLSDPAFAPRRPYLGRKKSA
jgi:hypothetical protein